MPMEMMCQQGTENSRFIDLLSQLRCGTCSNDDFNILNTWLLSNVQPDWKMPNGEMHLLSFQQMK
jgi:hypothetical protein